MSTLMCLHLSFSSQICTHTLSLVPPTGLSTPPKAPHTHILRSCQEWLHATVCFHTKRPFLVTFRRAGASPLCSSSPSTQNMSRSQLILRNYTVRLPKIQGETECSLWCATCLPYVPPQGYRPGSARLTPTLRLATCGGPSSQRSLPDQTYTPAAQGCRCDAP